VWYFSSATAAARALVDIPELSAEEVARKAMTIAANMCVYTNTNFRTEVIDAKEEEEKEETK
jgi:ATP-dependent HslUV protease subunit HslV